MEGFKQNFEKYLKDTNKDKQFEDRRYYLNEQTQEKILDIQEQKQALIEQMHELLKKVDQQKPISFEEHAKTVEMQNGSLTRIVKGNLHQEITVGDIMVAGMNGFDLRLDPSVDRVIQKQFILQETKNRIKHLYNKQLTAAEIENVNARNGDGAVEAYKAIEERSELGVYTNETQHGVLAEQMVESFMTKLITNNPHLPFTIEMADVYDDVRRKMDFKIHIKKEFTRGVAIDTGVQFTLNSKATEHKTEQIKKAKEYMSRLDSQPVDDIVLVTMSIDEIENSLNAWKEQGKKRSIGGPADHWSIETQKLVFTKMLEKLPESLNINPDDLWESTRNQELQKAA